MLNDLGTLGSGTPYKIVAEMPQFFVVSKAFGVNIHDENKNGQIQKGLIHTMRHDLGVNDLNPVHRIDKATSGLLLVGKGSSNTGELSMLFQQKKIQKRYWAIAQGKPTKKQGKIVGDLVKTRGGSYKLVKSRENPSITTFVSYLLLPGLRAYLMQPHTGRTHQLRVVMRSMGVPIEGDSRYQKPGLNKKFSNRLCLHASGLKFSAFGQAFEFEEQPNFGLSEGESEFVNVLNQQETVFSVPL